MPVPEVRSIIIPNSPIQPLLMVFGLTDGRIGEVTVAEEVRLEFAVLEGDLGAAVDAVRRAHPYEEPAIDVIPMIPWKSVIPSDGR